MNGMEKNEQNFKTHSVHFIKFCSFCLKNNPGNPEKGCERMWWELWQTMQESDAGESRRDSLEFGIRQSPEGTQYE
jgi:hypothetical protein